MKIWWPNHSVLFLDVAKSTAFVKQKQYFDKNSAQKKESKENFEKKKNCFEKIVLILDLWEWKVLLNKVVKMVQKMLLKLKKDMKLVNY